MASQTDICNQALTKIGADRILAITDDTKAASTLNAIWAIKRDAELAAQPWTFAIRRASLPASTTTPSFGWSYAYPLPSDYLAMVEVGEDYAFYTGDPQPLFALEGGEVLTDQGSPLNIRYVSRVTNTGLYPALFAEALACRLAAELCERMTQSGPKREAAWAEHKKAIREARRVNAIEQPPRNIPPGSWERALLDC